MPSESQGYGSSWSLVESESRPDCSHTGLIKLLLIAKCVAVMLILSDNLHKQTFSMFYVIKA